MLLRRAASCRAASCHAVLCCAVQASQGGLSGCPASVPTELGPCSRQATPAAGEQKSSNFHHKKRTKHFFPAHNSQVKESSLSFFATRGAAPQFLWLPNSRRSLGPHPCCSCTLHLHCLPCMDAFVGEGSCGKQYVNFVKLPHCVSTFMCRCG